ncbi:C1 family peptidase [Streptomyces sp. I05A-00742]|uniref:C1 family peptidase n=1 Tax=Streptomyces sp. I05A-00742 TaxID=2732853 RepID=UPI001487DE1B|nr:C1 family peptidase [Streptomyces sp. I05A-00742]
MTKAEHSGNGHRILNCRPSRETENDWRLRHAEAAGLTAAPVAAPPAEVDLREGWWKVNDQKDTGSCVGWATADSMLRWHFVKVGQLDRSALLSSRFIWMSSKETDEIMSAPTTFIEQEGTTLKAAVEVARKFGVVDAETLPFDAGKLFQGETEEFYARAARRRIAAYFNLGNDPDNWRTWMASGGGPILTRLDVDRTWDSANANEGRLDVYKPYPPKEARGGHAVAFVGYTSEGRFIVRNSWGTGWADGGFAYATEEYAKKAFTETYGVSLGHPL